MTIERQKIGTMPAATEKDDESYLDFVEGIRAFNIQKMIPASTERAKEAFTEFEATTGRKAETLEDAHAALDTIPIIQSRWRVVRTSQEMFWRGVVDTYRKREPELLAELDRADRSGPGTVEYNPNFPLPDYITHAEIHIQPGSYHGDPLAGHIYHYGTKVFNQGRNNNDEQQRQSVESMPLPADGQVNRILEIGCSVGQSTTAWKGRFPNAEVWGIDAGAPMVRYAHKRAVEMECEVHFAQRLSEAPGFPDNHFDIVYAFILFHELPLKVIEATVREAHRQLRPGGLFLVLDFMNSKGNDSPLGLHTRHMDETQNGEPWSSDFVNSDFTGLLESVFAKVDDGHESGTFLPLRVCEK